MKGRSIALILRVKKNYISQVLIFSEWSFTKRFVGTNFSETRNSLWVGLVQGGLEFACDMMVTMSGIVINYLLLTRYEKLLNKLFIEPKNEEITWIFLSVPNEEGKQAEAKSRQQKKSNRRRKKWDQETFGICCKTQDQNRVAPRKWMYLTSLDI